MTMLAGETLSPWAGGRGQGLIPGAPSQEPPGLLQCQAVSCSAGKEELLHSGPGWQGSRGSCTLALRTSL